MNPSPFCPFCNSLRVVPRAVGLKTYGALGMLVGAAGALHAALSRLPAGAVSTPGLALSGIAAAVLAALSASALGCQIGAKAGAQLDGLLFGNRFCMDCKSCFVHL